MCGEGWSTKERSENSDTDYKQEKKYVEKKKRLCANTNKVVARAHATHVGVPWYDGIWMAHRSRL